VEFLIFWLILCCIPAAIASKKGRNAFGWFVLSIFISPLLGGIIVVCLSPLRVVLEQRATSTDMRKCPHCAELVKREAKICRYCQRELGPVTPVTDEPPPPILSGIPVAAIPKTCPRCGSSAMRAIIDGRIYHCGPCGSDFEVSNA
jgi:ribosomal protein S27AE